MIYAELVTIILGISLLLYVVFGGADFGVGILEIFIGDRAVGTISKAIAPVWEANHIWLIIAVVILFNGYPIVYATVSTALHIPVLLALTGIIFRGAAFTFRHYDAIKDESQKVYSWVFRISSLLSTLFLGIAAGAIMAGTLPTDDAYRSGEAGFYALYLQPWLNPFCFFTGLFVTILSTYIGAIFLLGEVESEEGYRITARFIRWLFVASMIAGALLMYSAYVQNLAFFDRFFTNSLPIAAGVLATVLFLLVSIFIKNRSIWLLRLVVGAQVLLVVLGWLVVQWPNLLYYDNGVVLSIHQASVEESVMKILFFALLFGIVLIFPSLYYLFKVFKTKEEN